MWTLQCCCSRIILSNSSTTLDRLCLEIDARSPFYYGYTGSPPSFDYFPQMDHLTRNIFYWKHFFQFQQQDRQRARRALMDYLVDVRRTADAIKLWSIDCVSSHWFQKVTVSMIIKKACKCLFPLGTETMC